MQTDSISSLVAAYEQLLDHACSACTNLNLLATLLHSGELFALPVLSRSECLHCKEAIKQIGILVDSLGLLPASKQDLELQLRFIIANRIQSLAKHDLEQFRSRANADLKKGRPMSLEWGLVFQALSSLSAVVQAVKAGLETKKIAREELRAIAAGAEDDVAKQRDAAIKAGEELPSLNEDMIDTVKNKIKKFQKKWQDSIDETDDAADWARATDVLAADICSMLRNIKTINGGTLPREWYQLWTKNGCK